MHASWKTWLGNAFLVVLCALVVDRTVRGLRPAYNWDMLGYMALALEWDVDDPVEVHRQTYAAAKAELPRAAYAALVSPTVPVRIGRFQNPEAFHEHLAFYRARVVPTYLIRVLHRCGAPLSAATWWISVGAWVLTAVLLIAWLARRVPFWAAIVAGTCLAHAPPLLSTATLNTPDGLGTLLLLFGIFLFFERRALATGAGTLVLAIMTRPDAVILIGLLVVVLFLFERNARERVSARFLGGWLAASAVTYFAVQSYAGEYGWWPLFSISFLEKELYPSTLTSTPETAAYFAELGRQVALIPGTGYFTVGKAVTGSAFVFVYLAFATLLLALWRRVPRPETLQRFAALLVALLLSYAVRWVLFPQLWDRFFALLYLLVPLVAVSMAGTWIESRREPDDDDVQNASNADTASITSD